MTAILRLCVITTLLCFSTTQAVSQSTAVDIQAQAEQALVDGAPAQAKALAEQLLVTDPDSFVSWFILALAQSDLGAYPDAAKSAGQAYKRATTETEHLQASRLAGLARLQGEQYARAELWFRRAANHIQTEAEAETVVRAFQRARTANPISMQYTASIAPTDNINNGSADGILCFKNLNGSCAIEGDLPENQLPLSGLEFSGSAQFAYRLSQNDSQTTTLSAFVFAQAYRLSSDAENLLDSSPEEAIQDLSNKDFTTVVAQVSLKQRQNNFSPLGPTSVALNLGRFWRGGDPLVDYQDLILGQDIPISSNAALLFKATVRNQTALNPFLEDSVVHELSGAYATTLANDDQLRLTLTAKHSDAGFENIFKEYRAGINYTFAKPILNTRWSTSLELGYRSYDEFSITLDGRRDRFATIGADVVFEDVSYFGFSPSMSFQASKTESDVISVNSSQVQVRLGVSSNF